MLGRSPVAHHDPVHADCLFCAMVAGNTVQLQLRQSDEFVQGRRLRAQFAENSSGGGAWYPGSTDAGAQAATMVKGWTNRIWSVYLQ